MSTTLTIKETVLSAKVFLSLISIPNQLVDDQRKVVDFHCTFLFSASEQVLQACLQFATGSSSVPPMGFHDLISLKFTKEKRHPFARTCPPAGAFH